MFSSGNIWIMMFAVTMSMAFISLSIYYVNKLFNHATRDILVRFILIIFASLVAVFIVDKVVAFKVNLLSDKQNDELFDLIKTLVLMIFSYYFGTQKGESKKED